MNREQRRQRVLEILRAAQALGDPSTQAGKQVRGELIAQGPLSHQGVELALTHHLPDIPSASEMDSLLSQAGQAAHVHVVLSSNVFVGAVNALAMAAAAAPTVSVRMSRRESVFTRALSSQVRTSEFGEPIAFSETLQTKEPNETEVHLYGHDATLALLCRSLPSDVWVRPHGAGLGVVVVGALADTKETAHQVVGDIIPFDQRGCLSPRIVIVQNERQAVSLADELAHALIEGGKRTPVGQWFADELEERRRYWDTCRMVGRLWETAVGSVGISEGIWVPPVGRNVHVVACEPFEVEAMLSPIRDVVAALGVAGEKTDALVRRVMDLLPRARISPVGRMQRPVLDGFVDQRLLERLRPEQVVRRFEKP